MPEMKKISESCWEIPISYKEGMKVTAKVIANDEIKGALEAGVFHQISNVATLPGVQKAIFCMPDAHWGYGFPIGGVAAFDPEQGGIISPGGIGFDINCGMRLVRTNLNITEVQPKIKELIDLIYQKVPAGVGRKGTVKITREEFKDVVEKGAKWCLEKGYAWESDVEHIEDNGCIPGADASNVSDKAVSRGFDQLGTLGSGNHYLEIQVVKDENIFDREIAHKLGVDKDGQIVIMIHCGSRGFGHQIGTDYLRQFLDVMPKYGIKILDRELACAPINSPEGKAYYSAMACAANMAFVNRQIITYRVRKAFEQVFGKTAEEMEMELIYDVAHNIAKFEKHIIDGKEKLLLVHRKGATRAFGPSRAESLPEDYADIGQPVILGGSMETGSYLLVGTDKSDESFASTAHGAGRVLSRMAAKKKYNGEELQKKMMSEGIYVKAASMKGLAEEAGGAYKDINSVVDSLEKVGITKKVVALKPIGNVKG
ncbi:RtcB family protein [archaeon]|nr:RtcB family protein [archaeon]MBT3450347.1 RtcB family protein [archaeon]MBT6868878.1 RtcB family protein [archaeon]MBT7192901.1 RtcB family protein [archaeon]MBT7380867.1 RtcB family protein [archaeon]